MTCSRTNDLGQQSVGSEDRVETNGRTDRQTEGGDCITSHAKAVGNSRPNFKKAKIAFPP